jgi:hypothetical protein
MMKMVNLFKCLDVGCTLHNLSITGLLAPLYIPLAGFIYSGEWDGLHGPEEGWLRCTRASLRAGATVSQKCHWRDLFYENSAGVNGVNEHLGAGIAVSSAAKITANLIAPSGALGGLYLIGYLAPEE